MSGTIEGGRAAAQTNKARHGEDFYIRIGTVGGKAAYKGKKGFAAMPPEVRAAAGAKGGRVSRRPKAE